MAQVTKGSGRSPRIKIKFRGKSTGVAKLFTLMGARLRAILKTIFGRAREVTSKDLTRMLVSMLMIRRMDLALKFMRMETTIQVNFKMESVME